MKTNSPALRHIHHVQRHEHRQSQLHHLGNQKKISLQITRIHHTENRVRAGHTRRFSMENLPRNFLIRRTWIQTVQSREIDQLNRFSVKGEGCAGSFFDRHTRIVAHPLTQTGQGIKKSALPGIGVSHHSNPTFLSILIHRKSGATSPVNARLGPSVYVLDQNLFGQSGTQSHPCPANPANEIRPTTNFCHQGVFTKTHFSEALASRGRAL